MSKLLANQISNYNDNGPVEVKDGINVANGKPLQVAGASGTSGQFLKSTGSSVAWQDFPTIPAAQVNADWNATSGVAQISNKPTLHAVATSGQYSDLSGLPSIPAAQIQSDWNISNTSAVDFIKNKPTLFSGNWADLTGKPTIPSNLQDLGNVHNASPTDGQVLKWINANSRWEPATDATGAANTDTTYSQSSVASGSNVNLRLTAGGSGSGNDDILITAGNNIAISSVTAGGFTIESTASGGATVTTDDSAPSSPSDGDLWWKSDEGRLKIYYADGSSDQWVDASPVLSPTSMTSGSNSIAVTSTRSTVTGPLRVTGTLTGQTTGNKITYASHFIPDTNAAYDLGNAEYKVRHLFLSDNTLYYEGDFLKVAQHNSGGSAQSASYLIPLAKLKDALTASNDYEAFKTAILAITDA